jgi:hypothetical protein
MSNPGLTEWVDKPADMSKVYAAVAAAMATWADEMVRAIQTGAHEPGEWPTAQCEAVFSAGGVSYMSTLTFSVQPDHQPPSN